MMPPDQIEILWMVLRLLAVSTFLQSIEMLRLRKAWSESGPWRWSLIREDFQKWLFPFPLLLDLTLHETPFRWMLILRALASLVFLIWPLPAVAVFLFVTTLLIAWRWRGNFNGGSDAMTTLTSGSVMIALLFPHPKVILACLWFLAIQLTLSYFTAGLAKIRNRAWWSGQAMRALLLSSRYTTASRWLQRLAASPTTCRILSWLILGFETLFPLAFRDSETAALFLKLGIVFHLANASILGLNRFLWAWIAVYPAFFYCVFILRG